ncbi:MAG: hypothetical protein CL726_02970 [Chloroflexi bacterium]|nr:hypothetical protein [Chloroflexota bacterium]
MITSGKPVFVEFFSNSCTACLASQPIVQSLESEMDDDVQILKLNVQTQSQDSWFAITVPT